MLLGGGKRGYVLEIESHGLTWRLTMEGDWKRRCRYGMVLLRVLANRKEALAVTTGHWPHFTDDDPKQRVKPHLHLAVP